jgi:hypothetical protein
MMRIKESNDCSQVIDRFVSEHLGLKNYRFVPLSQGRLADVRKVESDGSCLVIKGERLGHYPFDPINLEFRILTHINNSGYIRVPIPIANWSDGTYSLVAMEFVPGKTCAEMPIGDTMAELPRIARVISMTLDLLNDFFRLNQQDAKLLRGVKTVKANKIIEKAAKYVDGVLEYKERVGLISDEMQEPLAFYPDFRPSNFIASQSTAWVLDFNGISFGRPSESMPYFIDDFLFDGYRDRMVSTLCKDSHEFHSAAIYINLYCTHIIHLQDFDFKNERVRFHLGCAAESSKAIGEVGLEKMFRKAMERVHN